MLSTVRYEVKYVKGIGPQRAQLLASELNIATVYDLLHHFPTSYIDKSHPRTVRSLFETAETEVAMVLVRGRFVSFNTLGEGAKMRLTGLFSDGTATMEVVWFKGWREVRKRLRAGEEYLLFGKPGIFNNTLQMVHPEVDSPDSNAANESVRAVYPLTERLRQRNITSRTLHNVIMQLLSTMKPLHDTLPKSVREKCNLIDLDTAIRVIHNPTDSQMLKQARLRLKFEELFYIQVDMLRRSRKRKAEIQGYIMPHIGKWFNDFYSQCLPFELTGAQKRVIKEIRADIVGGRQMNRLVQGDVGSGKTLVALMAMLLAIDNGYQACLMAPTEILATQHYETIKSIVSKIGLNVKLLTGSTRKKERQDIDIQLRQGDLHILVGTHAVLEDKVEFHRLGMAVIDEQHRFGVAQRARLWSKSAVPPHILVMTATPIPRTLAMTVYGDLDVSVIDELPPGRKPVATVLRYDDNRAKVQAAVRKQLDAGHQVYIVYPLVKENEKLDLRSVEEGLVKAEETYAPYKVALVHGQMKPAAKDEQMARFVSGEASIMVATTVIEVGVNVPNATTMIIENAERFGLSQLHQLRGRVGRGADRSYCVLMSKHKIGADTRKRLEIMTSTTDGFVIAEADMQMRGPGDIEGTAQSGLPFDLKIANLARDGQIIQLARVAAGNILDSDPNLTAAENLYFARALSAILSRSTDWSRIS